MRKLFNSLFVLAIAAMTFTSCEDVPMPYDMPTVNGGSETPTPQEKALDPAGKGTQDDPYNVAAAVKLAKALADKALSEQEVYVKGVVKSLDAKNENAIKTYGNATFVITDGEGYTQEFTVFQCLYLNKKKFTSTDQIKEGDTVVVYGKLTNYGGKPETEGKGKSYIYSLNSQTSSDTPVAPPVTDNSVDKPYSVNKSLELITGGKAPAAEVYVKGIISKVASFNNKYGSITYYISDDGKAEKELQVYGGLSFKGAKFASEKDLQVGQTVVVLGVIKAYTNKEGKTTNEVDMNNKLISVNGQEKLQPGSGAPTTGNESTTPTPPTTQNGEVTAKSFGLANAATFGTQKLADGTQIIAAIGTSKSEPKYYTLGDGSIRLYAGNTITFDAGSKKIESITITCDTYTDKKTNVKTDYTAEGKATVSAGSINLNGLVYTISGVNGSKVTLTNSNTSTGAVSQIRIVKFAIKYAK